MGTFDPRAPHAVVVEDRVFARPAGGELLARIYRPAAPGPWHALVDVHGGAWTYFDRTADAHFDRALAACGLVVVALDFRMGPAHPYPAAVADVVAGIRWTKGHAAALGAHADRVGLVGGSSGGHLLMLAALRPHDPAARYRYLLARRAAPRPARDPFFQPERLIEGHQGFFGDEATMERASALRVVEAGEAERLPPLWIAHPELDENVTLPMTERFVAAYRRAGGAAHLEVFPGVGHAFAHVPGDAADACIAHMRGFVARCLV